MELLRILAAIGVIVLHYNNPMMGGGLNIAEGVNKGLLYMLEALNVCAVNVFVLINGFFDVEHQKRDLMKPLKLIVQVMLFNLAYYFLRLIFGSATLSIRGIAGALIPANWFIIIYCGLYVISPYFNTVLKRLSQRGYKLLLAISICTFSLYPTLVDILEELTGRSFNGLSSIGMYGSEYGYTIVNFALIYMIGGYIRRFDIKTSNRNLFFTLMLNTIILAVWGYLYEENAWEYCNPLVIFQAVVVFLLFKRMQFTNCLVNKLAKASLCVYLIHGYFLGYLGIGKVVSLQNPLITVLHIVACGVGIYLIGCVVNLIYNFVIGFITRPVDKVWRKKRFYEVKL
ncbi:MAG: acyltransferase [Candidatus Weimeria sp.]